jgi:peroxiredoxin
MAQTPSHMLPLGTQAPEFVLPDTVSGQIHSLVELKGTEGTLVIFMCNHCPFVVHVIDEVVRIADEYKPKGINTVSISSNDVAKYPQDSPELMKAFALEHQMNFAYLYDETQQTAHAYDAACTPDFYLFDAQNQLVYRGQLDDSRPSNGIPVSGKDLRAALEALVLGQNISDEQKPSLGCNIKWKI